MGTRRLRHHYCDLTLHDNQVNQHKVVPYLLRELHRSFYNRSVVELALPLLELVVLRLVLAVLVVLPPVLAVLVLRDWEPPLLVLVAP